MLFVSALSMCKCTVCMLCLYVQCWKTMHYVLLSCQLMIYLLITGDGSVVPLNIVSLTELVTPSMATKWFEMGLQLGVDSKELKTIQHDTRDSKTACRAMFMEWLDTDAKTEKSWKRILTALSSRSVGRNTLAESLRHLE